MNFGKSTPLAASTQSGNAVIYLLIALALLGALTVAITRDNDNASTDLSAEQAEFMTTRMSAYTASVDNVVDQMVMSGTDIADIDFTIPTLASFDLGVHSTQLYHPDGGGINYAAADEGLFVGLTDTPPGGWYIGQFNNVEWTPTTADDVVMVAYQIQKSVCERLNKKITGSTAILAIGGTGLLKDYFVDNGVGSNPDFTETICPDCEGQPSLCVSNTGATSFAYYTIIEGL